MPDQPPSSKKIMTHMKNCLLFAVATILSGCMGNELGRPVVESDIPNSLYAFQDICIKTAPSFSEAGSAAEKYGIKTLDGNSQTRIGITTDNKLGIQVKTGEECVVTTPEQESIKLTQAFFVLANRNLKENYIGKFDNRAVISGSIFSFHHDREDGEAFIMTKTGSTEKSNSAVISAHPEINMCKKERLTINSKETLVALCVAEKKFGHDYYSLRFNDRYVAGGKDDEVEKGVIEKFGKNKIFFICIPKIQRPEKISQQQIELIQRTFHIPLEEAKKRALDAESTETGRHCTAKIDGSTFIEADIEFD